MTLDDQTLAHFRRRLLERQRELRGDLRDGIERRESEDDYRQLVGGVGDPGDASVATEQADLRNAQINRDVGELRDVQSALDRIDEGGYGSCVGCGGEIDPARLEANLVAARCIRCQTAYEKQYPTLISTTI